MAMWKVALVVAAIGVALSGCGTDDPDPAAPPGYAPTSLAAAWKNHFDAFGAQDVTKIKMDYTDQSIVRVFNDVSDDGATIEEHKGLAAIGSFFAQLFQDLGDAAVDVKSTQVRDAEFNTVLLVWNAPLAGFIRATDTFVFGNDFKIRVQNIVINKAVGTGVAAVPSPKANATSGRRLATPSEALASYKALMVQGTAKRGELVQLYLADTQTKLQHYEWNPSAFKEYTGHPGASDFHTDIVYSNIVNVLDVVDQVDADFSSAFFLWKSDQFDSVANTFVYDADGKIRTHTIVTAKKARVAAEENQMAMLV